jgi:PadR family transcriptional regulator PadR
MSRSRALSPHARTVLAVLLNARDHWSHGYELVRLAGVKSGTLYPLLIRLESQGYLEAEWQPPTEVGRPPRHAYRLTSSGVKLARANPPEQAVAPASCQRRATI